MMETGKTSEGHESSEEVCAHPNVFSSISSVWVSVAPGFLQLQLQQPLSENKGEEFFRHLSSKR